MIRSITRPRRPRRCQLSVPGSSEKMLAKAAGLAIDHVFLDLEDSVSPLEKEASRAKVVEAIKTQDWGEKILCVRVNAWDTQWTYGDIIEVVGNAGERLEEIMLPKVQTAGQIEAMDLLLTQVEKNAGLPLGHIGIEAQIETAQGLINVNEICAASPWRRSSSVRSTSRPPWRCHPCPAACRSPSTPATTSTTSS